MSIPMRGMDRLVRALDRQVNKTGNIVWCVCSSILPFPNETKKGGIKKLPYGVISSEW